MTRLPRPSPAPKLSPLFLVLATGALVATFLGYTLARRPRLSQRYPPLAYAVARVQVEAALFHLGFEEAIGGDTSRSIEDVLGHLQISSSTAHMMLSGGQSETGPVLPLRDRRLRREVEAVRDKINELHRLAQERLKTPIDSGIGSKMDQIFDLAFEGLIREAQSVARELHVAEQEDRRESRDLLGALLGLCSLLALLVGYILWRNREQRNLDIRSLRASEEALRVSEERLDLGMAVANDGIWDWNLVQDVTYFDRRYYSMAGYEPDEFPASIDEWAARVHPDDLERTKAQLNAYVAGQASAFDTEFRFRHKSGHWIWIRTRGMAVEREVEGTPIRMIGTHTDVTARKQVEGDRERLMYAIEQARESVVITDYSGTVQYINPAFEETSGYSRAEVLGQSSNLLKSGKHDSSFYATMWQSLLRGDTWTGRFVNRKKDGTLFTEEATISPVLDASGEIGSFVAVKHDITAFLALEEQQRQAQKVESIGRLAGGVAHDLNNLLTPILGHSELLLEALDVQDPNRESVGAILSAGSYARDLVHQLLAFARRQALKFRPVDPNKALTDFEKLLRSSIRSDIEIEVIPSSERCLVMADIGQIEQVIMNLAINAADSMPHGGRLTLEIAQQDIDDAFVTEHLEVQTGPHVVLSVSDTGCGMGEETRKQIFEPFFTTKGDSGTGLGLATVHGIVKQHGGSIWVYSELERGTTFKIYLPICGQEQATPAPAEAEPAEFPGGHETVLLVDDNDLVRNSTKAILDRLGYNVLLAENGAHALRVLAAQDEPIHLLLTDVIMPGMTGVELYGKASAEYPDLKIIYMSGYTADMVPHTPNDGEPCSFFEKPFTTRALAKRVRDALDAG